MIKSLHGVFGNDRRSWNQNALMVLVGLWFLMFMLYLELPFGIFLK